jgi:hypothetical protein
MAANLRVCNEMCFEPLLIFLRVRDAAVAGCGVRCIARWSRVCSSHRSSSS